MLLSFSAFSTSAFVPTTFEETCAWAQGIRDAEIANRRYRLSPKQTAELNYDDRLETRMALSRNTILELIRDGLLQANPAKGKIIVTERAIREYEQSSPRLQLQALPHLTGRVNLAQLPQVEARYMPAHTVRFAAATELVRVAQEVAEEEPEYADEAKYLAEQELLRRANKANGNA